MDTGTIQTDWVGIIALFVAFAALIHSIMTHRRQNKTQQNLMRIENARERDRVAETKSAKVRARIEKSGPQRYKLLFENEGQAEARGVRVFLDDKPMSEHHILPKNVKVEDTIGPGGNLAYPISFSLDRPGSFSIRILWTDDSEKDGKWESSLNIYSS